ncbi:hypothetical protein QBC37DRAFT_401642 [Rhypophila decipiens]|uniref:Uncharacterized protein n=1 Tax=Rhypophila decipiens TaxID=261697 RepID=A0AAN6Y6J9_9PEZI|nr:hypothetical protein QBC37DRAFT_401642 [Rhypophila decipiens]
MPLSEPFPEHLLDFFTLEDLSDPAKFALPDNSDLPRAPLRLHNGVVLGRKQKYWHATHLYTWANRLVAYTQDHFPGEGLGPINYGRWWIAPGCYSLTVTSPSVLVEREDPRDMNLAVFTDIQPAEFTLSDAKICKPFDRDITTKYGPDRMFDTRRFVRARVTFHFVDLTGKQHWTLLIRHAATNKGHLFVRIQDYPDSASSGIHHAFNNWLVASEMPKIDTMQIVEGIGSKPAEDIEPWTTPFHVLADLVTFMRFGLFGWENVPAFWPQWLFARFDASLDGVEDDGGVPTGPVIPPPEPRTGEIKKRGGKKRLMRDMLKGLNALVDEKEFQNKRRRYELQRRIAVWARRKRAEREKVTQDKEDADRYVDFFNRADEWNQEMDKQEQEMKRREGEEYKEGRRLRRDKLKLFKKLPPKDPVKEELDNDSSRSRSDDDSTDRDHEPTSRPPSSPPPVASPQSTRVRQRTEWEAEKNKEEKQREERRKMMEGIARRFDEDKKIPKRPGQVQEKMPTTPITPVDIEKMLVRLEWDQEHKEQLRLQSIQEEEEQKKTEPETSPISNPLMEHRRRLKRHLLGSDYDSLPDA